MQLQVGDTLALMASNVLRPGAYLLPAPAIAWASGADALLVWMLFISVLSTQNLLMFGLPQVFIRAIASAQTLAQGEHEGVAYEAHNGFQFTDRLSALREVQQVQTLLFSVFSLLIATVFAFAWGLSLAGPATAGGIMLDAALAWGVITVLTPLRVEINRILTLLHGLQDILKPRIWDAALWAVAGLFGVIAALATGSLLATSFCFFVPLIAEYAILRWHLGRSFQKYNLPKAPRLWQWRALPSCTRLRVYWAPTWRSGVGLVLNSGGRIWVGILFASQVDPVTGAAFLFAQNLYGLVMMLGSAPLSASLPKMAAAYQVGDRTLQISLALQSARTALWLTALSCLAILALFTLLAFLLPSDKLVDPLVWVLFSGALLAQRLGAAHLQHYSVTNKIIWHWVDGAAALGLLGAVALLKPQESLVVAGSVMLANLTIYWPLAMIAARRQFAMVGVRFDLHAAGYPVALFCVGTALILWSGGLLTSG